MKIKLLKIISHVVQNLLCLSQDDATSPMNQTPQGLLNQRRNGYFQLTFDKTFGLLPRKMALIANEP
jgi:hypothetical protein